MKKSLWNMTWMLGLVLVVLHTGCATRGPGAVPAAGAAAEAEEAAQKAFSVRDGTLLRGSQPFTLRAFEAPKVGAPKTSPVDLASALDRAAEVGANSICFELGGFSPDGKSLSPEGLAVVKEVLAMADWRRMGAICRVLGPDAPKDKKGRKAAVRAAAKALKRTPGLVYWIHGEEGPKLAALFRKQARGLVLAAQEGGEVQVVSQLSQAQANRAVLLAGTMPKAGETVAGYMLPATDQWYKTHDAAMADPIESKPWTPDNSVLTEQERKEGWIALFDGKSFNGWLIDGSPDAFSPHDGIMECVKPSGHTVLRSRDRYDNFMLRFDWKIKPGGNSGMFMRAPRAARQSKIGFEFQLQGDHGKPLDKNSTGSVYDVVPPRVDATKPEGEWNSVELTLDGPHYKAFLNGQLIQDLSFDDTDELKPRLRRGFFGLQDHASYIAFRNIRIKPLKP